MAFNAALGLVLVGSSILVLDKNIKIGWPLFQIIIIIEGLITFLAALGYMYQASDSVYGICLYLNCNLRYINFWFNIFCNSIYAPR